VAEAFQARSPRPLVGLKPWLSTRRVEAMVGAVGTVVEPIALMATIVALDQLAKRVVLADVRTAGRDPARKVGVLRPGLSTRAPICRLPRHTVVGLWVLVVGFAFLGTGLLFPGHLAALGLACALGGATSNLLDRLRRGGVVDFIALGFWPTFNIADVAIVGGLALAGVSLA
jgi:signal peptidase II